MDNEPCLSGSSSLEEIRDLKRKLLSTQFFQDVIKSIEDLPERIERICCLALGSPCESKPALYQLVLLELLREHLKLAGEDTVVFDPVFTEEDRDLFKLFHYQISDSPIDEVSASHSVLYFLPHAPVELTDIILSKPNCKYLLGNDITIYSQRFTDAELSEKYPILAAAIKLCPELPRNSGFTFVQTSNSRRKRKGKAVPVQPSDSLTDFIGLKENTATQSFPFSKCHLNQLAEVGNEQFYWANAFSDMMFHHFANDAS